MNAHTVLPIELRLPRHIIVKLLALVLLAVVAYASTPLNFWVADDYNYIMPKGIDRVISFFDPTVPTRAFYRPLNWTTWAIDYALWGKSPFGWHLSSIFFHVITTLSVALLTLRLYKTWLVALLAGAFFALHPSHTETVTFIGGRADLICGFFYFPAILFFVLYVQRRDEGRSAGVYYALSFVMAVGAILSKEMGITLPLVLILTDFFAIQRADNEWRNLTYWRSRIALHLPFFVLVGAYALMRYYLIASGTVTNTYVGPSLLSIDRVFDATVSNILATVGVWSAPVLVQEIGGLVKVAVLLGALIAAMLAVRWLKQPAMYCLLLWVLTLLPTFNLSALRWLYIPSFGICLLLALVASRIIVSTHYRAPGMKRIGYVFAGLVMLTWGAGTTYQNVMWYKAGEEARSILTQIKGLTPETEGAVTIYFAKAPSTYDTVLLFNTGLSAAMQYIHEGRQVELHEIEQPLPDPVIQEALATPPRLKPNPLFLNYEDGRVIRHASIEDLLRAGSGKE